MATTDTGVLGNVDLTGDEYEVVGGIIRRKWRVHDADGELLLRAKQKMLKAKEVFPFTDADGESVFTVKAEGIIDISGDYVLTDDTDDEPIAVLTKDFTLLKHVWHIHGPDGEEEWAVIESRSAAFQLLRGIHRAMSFLPHKYTIETPAGEPIGTMNGQFALKDKYDIDIADSRGIPKEALVASAIAVDALES